MWKQDTPKQNKKRIERCEFASGNSNTSDFLSRHQKLKLIKEKDSSLHMLCPKQ